MLLHSQPGSKVKEIKSSSWSYITTSCFKCIPELKCFETRFELIIDFWAEDINTVTEGKNFKLSDVWDFLFRARQKG